MSLAAEARLFLKSCRQGLLSSHSVKFSNYPFGSISPFVLDHYAQPILLLSTLAEHSHNIAQNPHVSLLVFSNQDDLQANARLTLLGDAHIINKQDASLKARYLRYHPNAESYFDFHDFNLYRINIQHLRYIAGFGRMSWFQSSDLINHAGESSTHWLEDQEAGILEHMNQDHQDAMHRMSAAQLPLETHEIRMIGLDEDGFDLEARSSDQGSISLRFSFPEPVQSLQEVRKQLIAMSKQV